MLISKIKDNHAKLIKAKVRALVNKHKNKEKLINSITEEFIEFLNHRESLFLKLIELEMEYTVHDCYARMGKVSGGNYKEARKKLEEARKGLHDILEIEEIEGGIN